MQVSNYFYLRLVASSLVVALLAPAAQAYPLLQQAAPTAQAGSSPATPAQQTSDARAELALPDNPTPVSPTPAPQNPDPQNPAPGGTQSTPQQQPAPDQQQNGKPLGTAAAPYEKTLGVAASRPAGAVIAPAKQRRVRTIWISVAAIVGAGVAVGTVVGLSKASSSRP